MKKRLLYFMNVVVLILVLCSCTNYEKAPTTEEFYFQPISTETATSSDSEYEDFLVGSVRSNVFHLSNCRYTKTIKEYNRIGFSSFYKAKRAGYRACYICIP